VHTGFCWGDLREGDHFEDQGIDGRRILKRSSASGMGGHDWVDMVQYRDKWLWWGAVVNTVMNLLAA
jgi:hypothetical protein